MIQKRIFFFKLTITTIIFLINFSNTQAAFTTYTNQAAWEAAVTGVITVEDFNSTATGDFSDPFLVSGFSGFCLSGPTAGDSIGIKSGAVGGNIDGSNYLGWSGSGSGPTINYNMGSQITAFGFNWNDTDPTDIWNVKIDGITFENPPFSSSTGTGFFGIISDTPFSLASMEQTAAGGSINNFGVDFIRTNVTGALNYLPSISDGAIISVTMDENGIPTPFNLTLNAADCDGDPINWSIGSPASNGTASVSGTGSSKVINYTPDANFSGSDSFKVRVSDAQGGTESIVNVTITPAPDGDSDGISDATENAVPDADGSGNGDGNNDGTQDSIQTNVVSLKTPSGTDYQTLVNTGNLSLTNVSAQAAPVSLPPDVTFPYGMIGFKVNAVTPGDTVNMDIYVPYNTAINGYYKKGNNGKWYNIAKSITHIGTIKTKISISLVEGGNFDTDSNTTTLTDPSAAAILAGAIPTLSNWMLLVLSILLIFTYRRFGSINS